MVYNMGMGKTHKRAGRPALAPEKKRSALVMFRVTEAEKAELEETAKTRGKTVSAVLTEALRAVLSGGRSWARCAFEGCKKRATVAGLCSTHYSREKKRESRARAAGIQNGQNERDNLTGKE